MINNKRKNFYGKCGLDLLLNPDIFNFIADLKHKIYFNLKKKYISLNILPFSNPCMPSLCICCIIFEHKHQTCRKSRFDLAQSRGEGGGVGGSGGGGGGGGVGFIKRGGGGGGV